MKSPRCIIIAGPNGAGKTTFAREFLPQEGVINFLNQDLLAAALSPLRPEIADVRARRLFRAQWEQLANTGQDFAFESTLSRLILISHLQRLKSRGYRIEIVWLCLAMAQLAIRRIGARVKQGGFNNLSPGAVTIDFYRGSDYFHKRYKPLADYWELYDNSDTKAELRSATWGTSNLVKTARSGFVTDPRFALRRAYRTARKTARMYGTPIYFWRDGKVVAEKP